MVKSHWQQEKIHVKYTVYQEKIMDTSFVWLYEALGTMALAFLVMAIVAIVIQYLEQETPWQPEKKNKH